ncbi:MAG: type secretion system protein [Frankiales bacterium]|jgi:type IV pilus assembly protein PilC|nr:type secretion system protein [Frankiales bacterium]
MTTATFDYKVRDKKGALTKGRLEADSEAQAIAKLRGMGMSPLSVKEANTGLQKEITLPGFAPKVKLKDLAVFSRQFATMLNSGLTLLRALSILTNQTENKELARILGEVRNDIQTGNSLSASMAKHPKVFPPLMVNMTKAGEVGGFLDTVLLQIAANYEAEVKLRGKVKAAMTYPVVVFIMAILMCVAMLLFIVPVFTSMFDGLGAQLPLPTRILVALSAGLKTYFPVLFVLLVGASVAYKRTKHLERVRAVVDPMKLKMPVFGPLFQKIALSRFSRNLGTMMSSGVPILQSLDIVADTTGNLVLARAIRDVQDSVRTGESLAGPLTNHPVFPPMVVQMMAVGEDTGALDGMLMKISQFYDQEVEATTEALTALIEPLMIAILGGLVGSMIIALYMPIFSIFDQIS